MRQARGATVSGAGDGDGSGQTVTWADFAAEPEAASAVLGRALAAGVVVASFGRRTLESRYLEWRAER